MMAPVKFGLFKARSRDQDPPSTENLLQNSGSFEQVATPSSPIPSTSKGTSSEHFSPDMSMSNLHLDSDDEAGSENTTPTRRVSSHSTNSVTEDSQMVYQHLTNQSSEFRQDDILPLEDDDSTTCDVNSIQFDETSIAPSEDISVYCLKRGGDKNKKNMKNKDMQILRDLDMWRASDVEVMQNLLSRSSNQNDQFKWEAIATARGLCTLTDNCTCADCKRAKYLAGVADGDGGLGAAPFIGAVTGCVLQ